VTGTVGSTPDNPIKLTQYRVTIWPKHGATENIYMEAPNVYVARTYTQRVYPEHTILAIKRVVDLVEERVS
jgi:hypothetical protein